MIDLLLRVGAMALLALVAIYLYAAAALFAHAHLARVPPPRSLAHAVLLGVLVPACGCTATPYARRASPGLRAPFLVAAYAASPLLALAAGLLAGPRALLGVLALAVLAALLSARLPPGDAPPRVRLDDLLLKRASRPLRDAVPYARTYALAGLAAGALVGAASLLPGIGAGLAVTFLALLFEPPQADLALDHGEAFARRLRWTHRAFSVLAGLLTWSLA